MRLIDADALFRELEREYELAEHRWLATEIESCRGEMHGLGIAIDEVKKQPTITAALTPETQASAADNTQWRPIEALPFEATMGLGYCGDESYFVPIVGQIFVFEFNPDSDPDHWRETYGVTHWMPLPEPPAIEANAHLLAAAPEMYEVLKEIVEEAIDYEKRYEKSVKGWPQKAKQVLAKAEGEG